MYQRVSYHFLVGNSVPAASLVFSSEVMTWVATCLSSHREPVSSSGAGVSSSGDLHPLNTGWERFRFRAIEFVLGQECYEKSVWEKPHDGVEVHLRLRLAASESRGTLFRGPFKGIQFSLGNKRVPLFSETPFCAQVRC